MGYVLESCDSADCQLADTLNHLRDGLLGLPLWDYPESISGCGNPAI